MRSFAVCTIVPRVMSTRDRREESKECAHFGLKRSRTETPREACLTPWAGFFWPRKGRAQRMYVPSGSIKGVELLE
jgi:hypothetical protein